MKKWWKMTAVIVLFALSGCTSENTPSVSSLKGKVVSSDEEETTLIVYSSFDQEESTTLTLREDDPVLYISDNMIIRQDDLKKDDSLIVTYQNHKVSVVQVIPKQTDDQSGLFSENKNGEKEENASLTDESMMRSDIK